MTLKTYFNISKIFLQASTTAQVIKLAVKYVLMKHFFDLDYYISFNLKVIA